MAMLETVKVSAVRNFDDFRFPVQYVNRPNLNFRGYCGTVASGIVRKGDPITVLPSGKQSRVKSIVTYDEELELASPQMAVTLTLEDEIDISRGDLIVHDDNLPGALDTVTATIVWMSEATLLPGKQYDFKHASKALTGQISAIRHKIDVNTLETRPAPVLELNEIGLCEVSFTQTLFFDPYKRNIATGAFIIIDRLTNVTVGAGMIESSTRVSRHHERNTGHVTTTEREARFGQKPVTVMFVGLSGSGKSTLAHALERRLFDMGPRELGARWQDDAPRHQQRPATRCRGTRGEFAPQCVYRTLFERFRIDLLRRVHRSEQRSAQSHDQRDRRGKLHRGLPEPPLSVCQARDPSGLYAAESNKPTGNVPGVSFPYEEPTKPDLMLPTHELDIDECVDRVLNVLKEREFI